jgi:hypothetical protein
VAALSVLWLDHGRVLRRTGGRALPLVRASWHELSARRFLKPPSLAVSLKPRYAWLHER